MIAKIKEVVWNICLISALLLALSLFLYHDNNPGTIPLNSGIWKVAKENARNITSWKHNARMAKTLRENILKGNNLRFFS
jgi:hypothetical protein